MVFIVDRIGTAPTSLPIPLKPGPESNLTSRNYDHRKMALPYCLEHGNKKFSNRTGLGMNQSRLELSDRKLINLAEGEQYSYTKLSYGTGAKLAPANRAAEKGVCTPPKVILKGWEGCHWATIIRHFHCFLLVADSSFLNNVRANNARKQRDILFHGWKEGDHDCKFP